MRYWYRDKDYVYIGFNYNANFVNKMKRDFGAKYNPALKEWYFEPSLEKSQMLKYFLEGNGFKNEKPERQIEIPLKEIKPLVNEKELKETQSNIEFFLKFLKRENGYSVLFRFLFLDGSQSFFLHHQACCFLAYRRTYLMPHVR